MRRAKWLLIPLVLLLLLVLATRIPWTERMIPLLLSRMGIHQVALDLAALDTGRIGINHFTATLDQPSGPIHIRISDATCRYRLPELFRGRVDSCSAATVAIVLPATAADSPQTDTALPDLSGLFEPIPVFSLPLRQLSIQRLLLHRNGADQDRKPIAVAVRLTTTDQESQLHITSAQQGTERQPSLAATFTITETQLSGTAQLQLDALRHLLPASPLSPTIQGTAKADLQLDLQTEQRPWQLMLSTTGLHHPQLTATDMQLQLDGTIPSSDTILLAPGSRLLLKNGKGQGVSADFIEADLAGRITLKPDLWQFQLAPAHPWSVDGLNLGNLRFTPLRFSALKADLRLTPQHLQATCTVAPPMGSGTVAIHLRQERIGERKGQATLQTAAPLIMSEHNNLLRLLTAPTLPVILHQGALKLSALGTWSRTVKPALHTTIDFTDGRGLIFGSPFSGLAVNQHLQLLPKIRSLRPGTIRLTQWQSPAPVDNFLLQTDLSPSVHGGLPRLHIKQAGAALFGGTVRVADCTYDPNHPQSTCTVHIREVDLPKIVALQKNKGLTVSGRVNGTLPIHLSAKGVQIAQGQLLNSAQGGIVRYHPPGAAEPSAGLSGYALKALEEFHYQRLAALIQYLPDGTLTVNLQLQGKSPKLDATRPVHLNINTEQNLLSLLKSLQYSHKLTSELDRQIQRGTHPPRAN